MKKKYISCNIIEHGFDAQIESINLCCRVSKENNCKKFRLIPHYLGEKINWDEFFSITDSLRDMQRNGNTVPQCQGCIYLEEKEWDNEHYISSVNINNWIKCNAFCIYCDRKESIHKKEYKIYPIIKDLVEKNFLRNPVDITIAGGEPTITSDFDKTIKLLIKHRFSPVRILTNAIKYNKYIQLGLKEGLVNILVSTDSGTEKIYKEIKLVNKHKVVWKNIAKYAKYQKIDSLVKTKYIIIPEINDSKVEIEEFVKRNKEAGIKYCCIDVEISWFCKNANCIEDLKRLYELYLHAKEFGKNMGVNVTGFDRMQIIEEKIK